MQPLSIFDMDKTITRAATFGPFLAYAVPRHARWRALLLPLVLLTSLGFLARIISRGRLKEINLSLMLGRRIDADRLAALSKGFAGQTLARNCLAPALARIEAERAAGRRVVLATASYAFYVREIAALLGIGDVIATRTTDMGRTVSPRIDGENCYGPAKLRMVTAWMAAQGIDRAAVHIRFFSDHVSDAPCMEWADEAVATNPHAPLRTLAAERGWHVVDWT
ncbi:MAG: HAD family hydrolase [Chakrabartia godavariana]